MSQIRKRTLKGAVWIYIGFLIGALNTFFLTHERWFNPEDYGLTQALIQIGLLLYAISSLGVTSYLFKFFPYYHDNLPNRQNDILGLALMVSMVGFILTATGVFFFKDLVVQKFSGNAAMLVNYFYLVIPFGFFILLYNILESYSYGFHKGVITSMLKETALRFFALMVILLKIFDIISFQWFIILYCLQYAFITLVLAAHLYSEGKLWLSFKLSRVTLKFKKKIALIMCLTFFTVIVGTLRSTIDALVLASKVNLAAVGIFGFAAYMVAMLQAPMRSMVAITIPILSRAWKDKNHKEINRIYKRSSINLLCFSLLVFFCIWLNYESAIRYFEINEVYLQAKWVFFLLGITAIIETGTGVNSQIIGTSSYWRFELWTSLLLTALIIPLSYYLTSTYGLIGPAIANLISFTVYNSIRYVFLWKKFALQPFSGKTAEILIGAVALYFLLSLTLSPLGGLAGLIIRTFLYILLFAVFIYVRNISPDVKPVLNNVLKRMGVKN